MRRLLCTEGLLMCMRKVCTCVILSIYVHFYLPISPLSAQDLGQLGQQPPVRLSSGFTVQSNHYSVDNIPYRRQPHNWNISGTPVLHVYGISIPFSFYWSNQQMDFQQPFNQFGISPRYKWATLHLGHSSVRFSEYTLAGRRFLGAGTELNPGNLRFGFVYGRFQKAVEQDTIIHSTPKGYLQGETGGAFERRGYAAKLGVSSGTNYLDFIFMHVADDTNSLAQPLSLETLNPEKNTVVGVKHRFEVDGAFWESDGAISFYTRDVFAEELDTSGLSTNLKKIYQGLDARLTTQLLYAFNTQVGYDGQHIRTSLRFRHVSRDFKTMGAYYFQTDVQEFALQLGVNLFEHRLHLRGNVGTQRNNLSRDRLHTTTRLITSLYTGAQLHNRLRLDVTYSNFGITQAPQIPGLSDSLRIDQVQQSLQVSTNYRIPSAYPQIISLIFSTQDLAPRQSGFTSVSEMQAFNTSAVYTISFPARQWTLSFSGQYIRQEQVNQTVQSQGGGITVSKNFMRGRIQAQTSARVFDTAFGEFGSGNTLTLTAALNFRITSNWSARANLTFTESDGSGQHPGRQFNETMVTFGSQFNF